MEAQKANKKTKTVEQEEIQEIIKKEELSSYYERRKRAKSYTVISIILLIIAVFSFGIGTWLISYVVGSANQRVSDNNEFNPDQLTDFASVFGHSLAKISYVMIGLGAFLIILAIVLAIISAILIVKIYRIQKEDIDELLEQNQALLDEVKLLKKSNLKLERNIEKLNIDNQEHIEQIRLLTIEISNLKAEHQKNIQLISQQKTQVLANPIVVNRIQQPVQQVPVPPKKIVKITRRVITRQLNPLPPGNLAPNQPNALPPLRPATKPGINPPTK
ncbi:hypothetical protein [Mycoplasma sp. E35C]|uniref:hypothetical protein n=1 Tax=Mycoplasma sp. E35C TaxID=2801918 RepID=UPI001CA38D7D|nr:hypothetical protein [Mycoplasma sp. E35C]QZX49047.1 hypothetical protein JJE79_03245 [Mycoplasma sp. E35C]